MGSSAVPAIGARLRMERRRRGMSVRGLAREIGVSASLISQIETDKSTPSVSTLYAITTALDISIEELFGDARSTAPAVRAGDGDGGNPEGEDSGLAAAADLAAADLAAADLAAADLAAAGSPWLTEQRTGRGVPVLALAQLSAADRPGGALEVPRSATLQALTGMSGLAAGEGRASGPVRNRRVGPVVGPSEREVLCLDSGVTWELLGQIPGKHVDFLLITYQPGGSSSSSGLLMRHSGTEYGYVISGELTLTLGFDRHRLKPGDAVSFESTTPHGYSNEGDEPAVGVWFVLERSA